MKSDYPKTENIKNLSDMHTRGRILFYRYKPFIRFLTKIASFAPYWFIDSLWTMSDAWRGSLGLVTRYVVAKNLAKNCGDVVYIGPYVEIRNWRNLEIGSNVSIHRGCYVDAAGEIFIGNDVSIAHGTSILSSDHRWEDSSIPIRDNPVKLAKVCIMSDVWIGCGSRILSGVSIGPQSIIAAGAVVTRNVSSNSIVGGVPAKHIKNIEDIL